MPPIRQPLPAPLSIVEGWSTNLQKEILDKAELFKGRKGKVKNKNALLSLLTMDKAGVSYCQHIISIGVVT